MVFSPPSDPPSPNNTFLWYNLHPLIPKIHSSSTSLQKRASIPGISTVHGKTRCNRTRHKHSYQCCMRQANRRKSAPRANKRFKDIHTLTIRRSTKSYKWSFRWLLDICGYWKLNTGIMRDPSPKPPVLTFMFLGLTWVLIWIKSCCIVWKRMECVQGSYLWAFGK